MPGTRDYNEDSLLCIEGALGRLFVVADGLGGHGKGEVASAIAIQTFKESFERAVAPAETFIPETIMAAQYNILQEQQTRRAASEMRTTCVALLVSGGVCRVGHVGDTRAYTFYKNKTYTRTIDHSVPQMLVMSGDIKEKEIRGHPDRNRLMRVMGTKWDSPRYELSEDIPMDQCRAFLLCSDGFWELCLEKRMLAWQKKSKNAEEWLRRLTDEVEKNGRGKDMDNYTAIAVMP